MALTMADVKAVHADLDHLLRLTARGHPWGEIVPAVQATGARLLQLAPLAEDELERRAVVTSLFAVAIALHGARSGGDGP